MKKNDIAVLLLVVVFAGTLSYVASGILVGGSKDNQAVQVEQVVPIAPNFPTPDERVFNSDAIDPTVNIDGSSTSTDKPFDG